MARNGSIQWWALMGGVMLCAGVCNAQTSQQEVQIELRNKMESAVTFIDAFPGVELSFESDWSLYSGQEAYVSIGEQDPDGTGVAVTAGTLRDDHQACLYRQYDLPLTAESEVAYTWSNSSRYCTISYYNVTGESRIADIFTGPLHNISLDVHRVVVGEGVLFGYFGLDQLPHADQLIKSVHWVSGRGSSLVTGDFGNWRLEWEFTDQSLSQLKSIQMSNVQADNGTNALVRRKIEFSCWEKLAGFTVPTEFTSADLFRTNSGEWRTGHQETSLTKVGQPVLVGDQPGDCFTKIPNKTAVVVDDMQSINHHWVDGNIVAVVDQRIIHSLEKAEFKQSNFRKRAIWCQMSLIVFAVAIGLVFLKRRESGECGGGK